MDFGPLIDQKRGRFRELEKQVAAASLFENPKRAREVLREHSGLKVLLEDWDQLEKSTRELRENREMATGTDAEFAELAQAEIPALEERVSKLSKSVQYALLPPEPHEDRDAIMEIRAGTGGNEAGLFAADLYRMYSRYAETRGFKIEELEGSGSELGGFKEIIFKVSGPSVFRVLRYESGVHRVQRVPLTEAQGRIHTSTATVAVLPEAEDVDIEINPSDLQIDVYRSSGPGGQSVNTTDSAVRITHKPSGIVVSMQDEKSQLQNRERAMRGLRARLYDRAPAQQQAERVARRPAQVGTGARSEKARSSSSGERWCKDHRINLLVPNLDEILLGELDEL